MTFAEYLAERPARLDIEGEFVRLARTDAQISHARSFSELRRHLQDLDPSYRTSLGAQQVWTDYQRKLVAQPNA